MPGASLDRIFAEQLYPDFAALWLLAHASRLRPEEDKPLSCILERWRAQAHETGERALEHLREGVTEALASLGSSFLQHPKNDALRAALSEGGLSAERYFQELLRLVYQLLFLFTAEERDLLHLPEAAEAQRAIYADFHGGKSINLFAPVKNCRQRMSSIRSLQKVDQFPSSWREHREFK